MKYLLLTSFFLVQILSYSISQISTFAAKVVNKNTNEPIEYANIYVKEKQNGTLTDKNGLFKLSNILPKDTIIISCVGYEPISFPYTEKVKDIFLLTPKIYELATSTIKSGKPKIIHKGFTTKKLDKNKIAGSFHGVLQNGYDLVNTGVQMASFIDNSTNEVGLIQNVEFYLHKRGIAAAPFRVRLYAVNEAGKPTNDLIHESIIINHGKNGKWVKVDLKDYQVEYPPNGFFIAMEWLQTNNRNFVRKVKFKKITRRTGRKSLKKEGNLTIKRPVFGQILGSYEQPSEVWSKSLFSEWENYKSDSRYMIRCAIKVWN